MAQSIQRQIALRESTVLEDDERSQDFQEQLLTRLSIKVAAIQKRLDQQSFMRGVFEFEDFLSLNLKYVWNNPFAPNQILIDFP